MQSIGERAGVSRGSIFWPFGSKEGLLWAVVERAFAEWQREVLVPDVGEARGIEAVRRALGAHRRFLSERGGELRLMVTAALAGIAYQRLLDPEGFDLDRVYADLDAVLARGLTSSV